MYVDVERSKEEQRQRQVGVSTLVCVCVSVVLTTDGPTAASTGAARDTAGDVSREREART